jgi:DNA primase
MTDGDKAGERQAHALLTLVSPHRLVRWLKLAEGKQPTALSVEQLKMSFIN